MAVVPGRYRVHRSSVGGREHVSLSRGWTAADGSRLRRHRCSHCAGKDINPSAASVCVPGMPGLEFCYGAFRVRELLQLLEKELWRWVELCFCRCYFT